MMGDIFFSDVKIKYKNHDARISKKCSNKNFELLQNVFGLLKKIDIFRKLKRQFFLDISPNRKKGILDCKLYRSPIIIKHVG